MTAFWVAAALLTLVVVALIVPPLLGRQRDRSLGVRELNVAVYHDRVRELERSAASGELSPEALSQARQELDQALLADVPTTAEAPEAPPTRAGRWLAVVVAIGVPASGVVLYGMLGAPEALAPGATAPPPGLAAAGEELPPVEEMVEQLEQRLSSQPDDAEGWVMLGRTYVVLGRHADATAAYARAHALLGDVPDLLVDYAEAMALAEPERLTGEAGTLAARALDLAPTHPKALWLVGFAARQSGDSERAVALWSRLRDALPEGQQRTVVDQLIAMETGAAPAEESAAPAGPGVTVEVALAEALAGAADDADVVYVFARAVGGPPMPVAIARLTAGDLPATVRLDDTMSMLPSARLSQHPEVVIGARVSKSGDPIPASGDLQGTSDVVAVAELDGPVQVLIEERIP